MFRSRVFHCCAAFVRNIESILCHDVINFHSSFVLLFHHHHVAAVLCECSGVTLFYLSSFECYFHLSVVFWSRDGDGSTLRGYLMEKGKTFVPHFSAPFSVCVLMNLLLKSASMEF
jgi:hypothetical protein